MPILTDALHLLDANWEVGEPVRLIGVGVRNLRPVQAAGQYRMDALVAEARESKEHETET